MSRLDYAPKLKEIQLTDIKKGLGVFMPKPDKQVSFAALKATLKKAGYTLASADITITGKLVGEDNKWWIVAYPTGQRFALEGAMVDRVLAEAIPDTEVEITGDWKTVGDGASSREVVAPQSMKKAESTPQANALNMAVETPGVEAPVRFEHASFAPILSTLPSVGPIEGVTKPLAPIRTTSPGLTVYQGGAVTPRLYLIKQHLGNLDVSRQLLDVSVSYTPSPRLQLEVEVPVSRTAFDDGLTSGSGVGLGNITLWSKYRFYRTVKTYGDRQAAARFGLELPTGKKRAPSEHAVDAPTFVRQQLTPISGGLSPHLDVAFSQAGGRFIFGGNVEAILRSERDGFRMGHELRVNTDLEYVLLPRDYQAPGKELFVILETNFVQRGRGRVDGAVVEGSKATEFYLSPGLQYAADPRFVIEGSVQVPVVRNTGPLVLRTDINVLLGVKYLF
ncbi:MAG TPA: transporter [Pyrinomonadaceae bacterium]